MAPRSARRATGVAVKAEAERALIVTGDVCVCVWRVRIERKSLTTIISLSQRISANLPTKWCLAC